MCWKAVKLFSVMVCLHETRVALWLYEHQSKLLSGTDCGYRSDDNISVYLVIDK